MVIPIEVADSVVFIVFVAVTWVEVAIPLLMSWPLAMPAHKARRVIKISIVSVESQYNKGGVLIK